MCSSPHISTNTHTYPQGKVPHIACWYNKGSKTRQEMFVPLLGHRVTTIWARFDGWKTQFGAVGMCGYMWVGVGMLWGRLCPHKNPHTYPQKYPHIPTVSYWWFYLPDRAQMVTTLFVIRNMVYAIDFMKFDGLFIGNSEALSCGYVWVFSKMCGYVDKSKVSNFF